MVLLLFIAGGCGFVIIYSRWVWFCYHLLVTCRNCSHGSGNKRGKSCNHFASYFQKVKENDI